MDFWVQIGEGMDVAIFLQAVKMVMRAAVEKQDTLVHCKKGKHRSGSLLIFMNAVVGDDFEDGCGVDFLINAYAQRKVLHPHDRGCIYRVWQESGLWQMLDTAKEDPEIQSLAAQIRARMNEEMLQKLEGSRRPSESQSKQELRAQGVEA